MNRRFVTAALVLGCWSGLSSAADWAQWRGPSRDGVSKETGLLKKWPEGGPKLLWTVTDIGVGYGSPAIVGDQLFILGSEDPDKGTKEFAICLNVKDGKQVWKTPLETADGNYSTGWGSGPRSTPTVDGDMVYVLGAKGDLLALKKADGKRVWKKNLVKDFAGRIPNWGYSESVLIDGDALLCTPGGNKGTILALNKNTGEELWRSKDVTDAAAYSSIVINNFGVKHYVQMTPNGVIGVSTDGKLLWNSTAGKNGVAVIPTPIVVDQYVFVTSGYGSGCGLIELSKDGDGKIKAKDVYRSKLLQNHHGGVIRVGEYVYGHSDRGGWMCVEFKKESEDAVWKSTKLDKGSIVYADGHFYCYGQSKGVLAMIEASTKGWNEVGRFEIPKKSTFPRRSGLIWAHPVIANGKLYLRDHELLFCYDLADVQ